MSRIISGPIWHSAAGVLSCRHGHKRIAEPLQAGRFRVDLRRLDGVLPFTCDQCHPTSHALIVVARAVQHFTYYEIDTAQLDLILLLDPMTPSIDVLRMLGYAPEDRAA